MKRDFHADGELDRVLHPLDLDGMRDIATALVWDGQLDDALTLTQQATEWHHATGCGSTEVFYQLLGIKQALHGVIAHRNRRRSQRWARRAA